VARPDAAGIPARGCCARHSNVPSATPLVTDDAELCERAGFPSRSSQTRRTTFKVTTADDLRLPRPWRREVR